MKLEYILGDTLKIYFKNIIVNLFFSALIMLLPYLQYVFIQNESAYITAFILTLIAAFASVALVYAPFIVSVHKERITKLWRVILRDVLILSAWWSVLYAALFTAFLYLFYLTLSLKIVAVIVYILLAFLLWIVMVLNVSHIVCSATAEEKKTTIWKVVNENKMNLLKLAGVNLTILFLFPIAVSSFLNRRALSPVGDSISASNFEGGMLGFASLFTFPFTVIFIYNGYLYFKEYCKNKN